MDHIPRHSGRDSIGSQATSNLTTAHMLSSDTARHNTDNSLEPPSAPFALQSPLSTASSGNFRDNLMPTASNGGLESNAGSSTNVSLMVNYVPQKFSGSMLTPPNPRRRRPKQQAGPFPKRGGGVEAFKGGEARIADQADEDYDGVQSGFGLGRQSPMTPGKHLKRRLKWNKFKITLFVTNTILAIWSVTGLVFLLLVWFNVFTHSDILRVGNRAELSLSTIAVCCGLLTAVVGYAGILLNNRSYLAVYTFLTWITFAFLVVPGYVSYHRRAFNLEGKINSEWSRDLGAEGRLRIQNQLGCCGYFSPFVEATISQTCYARSVLPGCKLHYLDFQRMALRKFYTVAFALVPAQLAVMIAGLLCSNHVTYRFGKGMMPKAYRLSLSSMAVIVDQYASELAEQYGTGVAQDVIRRSKAFGEMGWHPSGSGSSTPTGRMDTVNSGHSLNPLLRKETT